MIEVCFSVVHNGTNWSMRAWDVNTRLRLCDYIGVNREEGRHFLSVGSECIVEAQEGQARINVWQFNKTTPVSKSRIIAPGRISTFTAANDNKILAFAEHGKIYIYQSESGKCELLSHLLYSIISVLKFSKDGSYLAAGGCDGELKVWNTSNIFTDEFQEMPVYSQFHHTFAITDMVFSTCLFKTRLVTVSEDRIVKLLDIQSLTTLLKVDLDSPLSSIIMSRTNAGVYIGDEFGTITEIQFTDEGKIRRCYDNSTGGFTTFDGHTQTITCMVETTESMRLISGSKDCTIRIWNTERHVCLFVFNENGPVLSLAFAFLPDFVFGEVFNPDYKFRPVISSSQEVQPLQLKKLFAYWQPVSNSNVKAKLSNRMRKRYKGNFDAYKRTNGSLFRYLLRRMITRVGNRLVEESQMVSCFNSSPENGRAILL